LEPLEGRLVAQKKKAGREVQVAGGGSKKKNFWQTSVGKKKECTFDEKMNAKGFPGFLEEGGAKVKKRGEKDGAPKKGLPEC